MWLSLILLFPQLCHLAIHWLWFFFIKVGKKNFVQINEYKRVLLYCNNVCCIYFSETFRSMDSIWLMQSSRKLATIKGHPAKYAIYTQGRTYYTSFSEKTQHSNFIKLIFSKILCNIWLVSITQEVLISILITLRKFLFFPKH